MVIMTARFQYLSESTGDVTTADSGEWRAYHFSQANLSGSGQADVPALLRRVAATIEGMGAITIMDIVMHNDVNADGDWYSLTVYYDR